MIKDINTMNQLQIGNNNHNSIPNTVEKTHLDVMLTFMDLNNKLINIEQLNKNNKSINNEQLDIIIDPKLIDIANNPDKIYIDIDDEKCEINIPGLSRLIKYTDIYYDGKFYLVIYNNDRRFVIGNETVIEYYMDKFTSYIYDGILTVKSKNIKSSKYTFSTPIFNKYTKRYNFMGELLDYGYENKVWIEEFDNIEFAQKYIDKIRALSDQINKEFWNDLNNNKISNKDAMAISKVLCIHISDKDK